MHIQTVIVALLVGACSLYAVWTLMPAVGRRALAASLLRLPLPERLCMRLRRMSTATGGCGCDGCDRAEPAAKSGAAAPAAVITFHPRKRH